MFDTIFTKMKVMRSEIPSHKLIGNKNEYYTHGEKLGVNPNIQALHLYCFIFNLFLSFYFKF